MHNTCEDSLLATPLILDLAILCEVCERIQMKRLPTAPTGSGTGAAGAESAEGYERMHPVLSLLSYLLKAPLVPQGTPVVNALAAQRQCIINVFRACVGLPAENYMLLEHRVPSMIAELRQGGKRSIGELSLKEGEGEQEEAKRGRSN
mmetsp:Transcript_6063/g.13407  ORF Transcript_6063/g.13407 Transcript_6063/m.13407 type:complete len:148 (+) Transcript_6063:1466-1909(+)